MYGMQVVHACNGGGTVRRSGMENAMLEQEAAVLSTIVRLTWISAWCGVFFCPISCSRSDIYIISRVTFEIV